MEKLVLVYEYETHIWKFYDSESCCFVVVSIYTYYKE